MDRKDLKIEHYKQKVAELSVQYEDKIADLRVELTVVTQERDDLQQLATHLQDQLNSLSEPTEIDEDNSVVRGEVVNVSEEEDSETN